MSWASSPAVRNVMLANRRRDTSIELRVRKRLHADGFRYRVDYAPVDRRRRADIVFTRARVAVFIDGCFWHQCPVHFKEPQSNREYWIPKLSANASRDHGSNERLTLHGWTVLRFWEHQDADEVVRAIETAVVSGRS